MSWNPLGSNKRRYIMFERLLRLRSDGDGGGVYEDPAIEPAEQEEDDTSITWDYNPPAPDPMDVVRNELRELKAMFAARDDSYSPDTYRDEVVSSVKAEILPELARLRDDMAKPHEVASIVNLVAGDLGQESRRIVEEYLSQQPYTAEQLRLVREDKATMGILRKAAESGNTKRTSAPRSEGTVQAQETVLSDETKQDVEFYAREVAATFGIPMDEARKKVSATYKREAANA
jgi:hypothetical protein